MREIFDSMLSRNGRERHLFSFGSGDNQRDCFVEYKLLSGKPNIWKICTYEFE